MKLTTLTLLIILTYSCNSQRQEKSTNTGDVATITEVPTQIANYVVSAYEDSSGRLWFGTLEKGIARFNGDQLKYFTKQDGLPSNRVTSMVEDSNGILWFGTGTGISAYDGLKFTNYRVAQDDWSSNSISVLFIDSQNQFWVGTWGGVYTFDGDTFTPFPLPYPDIDTPINPDTKHWITEITQDPEGSIWFARDGYGACKFDGESFDFVLRRDGLHSNNVTEIEFDTRGNIWFGTRVAERDNPDPNNRVGAGGINKWSNGEMTSFPKIKAFNKSEVYSVYHSSPSELWISTTKDGLYCYDGSDFKHYPLPISVMEMLKDRQGNLWLAGAGGLYKIDQQDKVINVTTAGPW